MRRLSGRRILVATVSVALITLLSGELLEQTTGRIERTVKDDTGAVLPGVTITIREVDTGASRIVVTNTLGRYSGPERRRCTDEVTCLRSSWNFCLSSVVQISVSRSATKSAEHDERDIT
jgi:hypothetical protein